MSKICIIGDAHFRGSLPYAVAIEDGRQNEWNAVKKVIHETAELCDAVVFLGDNLNSRNNTSVILKEFVEFLKAFGDKDLYMICGNHERGGFSTAIDFLKKIDMPNWHIFTEISAINMQGRTAVFIPYMTPGVLGVENIEQATKKIIDSLQDGDFLFHHHAMSGAKWSGGTAEHLNEIVLPREALEEKFSWIFGGHIHQPQKFFEADHAGTYGTGNIFTNEVGDHEKFIWMLDTLVDKVTPIKLPVRGIYSVDFDELPLPDLMKIPSSSIVKCIITKRDTPMDMVKMALKRFDAHIIVENYPNERKRVALNETGALDLSLQSLLKIYSDVKLISYADLQDAFDSLEHQELRRT